MNTRIGTINKALIVFIEMLLFVGLMAFSGHAQVIDRNVSLSIMRQYDEMHENERYLKMKDLVIEKGMLSAEESGAEKAEQIDAEIGIIANSLRTSLFRNPEKILNLQQLRYELFTELLIEKHAAYESTKCSDKPGDIVKCDALFAQMQKLEVKVSTIEAQMKSVELTVFKEQMRLHINDQLGTLSRVDRDDFAAKVKIKREILLALKEIVVRLRYSTDTIDRVEKEIKALDDFMRTYSYWDEIQENNEEDMLNVYKTPFEEELPRKPWDDSQMEGRRKYVDTIVTKENDKRKGTKRNPRNIKKSAPQSMLGKNIKEKARAREE